VSEKRKKVSDNKLACMWNGRLVDLVKSVLHFFSFFAITMKFIPMQVKHYNKQTNEPNRDTLPAKKIKVHSNPTLPKYHTAKRQYNPS
jgi:hypothetical protein